MKAGGPVSSDLRPAKYHLSLAQKGFEPIERDLDLSAGAFADARN